jgi:hypothetical protein
MNTERKKSKFAGEVLLLDRGTAAGKLYERAVISILKDYTHIITDSLDGLLLQANALGFKVRDLTHEAAPEPKGILICREEGDNSVAIAFIGLARRLRTGGVALHIHRLDKVRVETLELRKATTWN